MQTREISLAPASNEADGYSRHFKTGLHTGRLLFGFDDRHFGRNFYITATYDYGQMGEETTYMTADTATELVDFMNDDRELSFFLETL